MNANSKSMQVKQQLMELIDQGVYRVGEQLPSEIQMSKQFQVSRETFRGALKMLEEEGRILVKHGVGTFVIRPLPPIKSTLERLYSSGEMIRSANLTESESMISLTKSPCPEEAAERLGIAAGDAVYILKRIRKANDEPVMLSVNYLPAARFGEGFEQHTFSGSLLKFVEDTLGVTINRADTEIAVPLHIDRNCQQLLQHPHTTVLLLKQLHYDEGNQPVFYSQDYMRNDVFTFHLRRTR
ncbi:GntR family transcriptional regulator [Paenibacillus algicola]|uniref:GntR family transcriptional regulator n=1 Tax=Paenibacillus algicola TaxID=2565926 RepID=A0A4P8XGI7_9BACL|nr:MULTISPECIES: GntR family transcriptional regulator [Paenibacillus]QCT01607.1 GntR family transcriptional regulator [Paenibacillus algicola]